MNRAARMFALALLSTVGAGCEVIKKKIPPPTAVNELAAEVSDGGELIVTWNNPIDFQRVELELEREGPDGKPQKLDQKRFSGFATARGAARAVLLDAPPGNYVIRVSSKPDPSVPPKSTERKFVVPIPLPDGLITKGDLLRRVADPVTVDVPANRRLHVLYAIHPDALRALAAAAPHVEQLFRQMTFSALSNVFATAVEVSAADIEGDTSGLGVVKRIDDYAALVAESESPTWPLRPDALVFVDVRLAARNIPGQLAVRLHDLRLTSGVEEGAGPRSRLFNVRPLVFQRYANIGPIKDIRDEAEVTSLFREAWLDNVSHLVQHPRYAEYAKHMLAFNRTGGALPRGTQQRVQNLLLAEFVGAMKPFDADSSSSVKLYQQRTARIMGELVFGPGVSGPADIHPNRRFKASPRKPANPKPTEPTPAKPGPPKPTTSGESP